jgi:hypothetical protein
MSLHNCTAEIQGATVKLYLKLEQRFKENKIIGELWGAMAHDVSQQIVSLNALPQSFWNRLKSEDSGLSEPLIRDNKAQDIENNDDTSLRRCFEVAIAREEATTLNIYVPIIRSLRKNWTEQALDFYIMVKAHLARITRVTEEFAGDPLLIQCAHVVLRNFEKEVQETHAAIIPHRGKTPAAKPDKEKLSKKKRLPKPSKHSPLLANRSKMHANRSKPLVEKVDLRRRRARR